MESRQRASREQFSIMIEFMERHGDNLRPHSGVQGRLKSDQMWKERQSSEVPFEPSQREDIHVEVPCSQNTTSRVPSPPDTLRGISPLPPVPTPSSPRRTPSPPKSPPVQTQRLSRTTSDALIDYYYYSAPIITKGVKE
ncbi:unnamed protein product [Diatraea saccharalis]|uniref:Uncharacterized protein n=1 Tax=Diatraea saccharalis TaxID=40085 RepID=A0A9N9WEE7_9NEOP|nr:unnamed protein product [Diatraea saccharalis]